MPQLFPRRDVTTDDELFDLLVTHKSDMVLAQALICNRRESAIKWRQTGERMAKKQRIGWGNGGKVGNSRLVEWTGARSIPPLLYSILLFVGAHQRKSVRRDEDPGKKGEAGAL